MPLLYDSRFYVVLVGAGAAAALAELLAGLVAAHVLLAHERVALRVAVVA